MAIPRYLIVRGYSWATLSPGGVRRPCSPGWGLGVKLTTSACKKEICWEFSEKINYKRPRLIHRAVVQLVMMFWRVKLLSYVNTFSYFGNDIYARIALTVSLNFAHRANLWISYDNQNMLLLFPWTSPALGPTQPPVQWIPGVLSPGVKRGRGVTPPTHPHLVPKSRMSRSYTYSPTFASIGVLWDCFTFTYWTIP
jgi:hypothetical protein